MSSYFGSSLTSPSSGLTAANINQLIQATLNAQRAPIRTITAQKDELNVRKSIYTDLKTKLTALAGIVENLNKPTESDEDTIFQSVSATSSDTSVVSVTAEYPAATGTYNIEVTTLAKAHRVSSTTEISDSSADLEQAGTFTIEGRGEDGSDILITVESGDSLEDIRDAINSAEYEDGKEIKASIVKGDYYYLVLEAETGTSNEIVLSNTSGDNILSNLGILNITGDDFEAGAVLQAAADADFTVNGIQITDRGTNTLDDVIDGVTLTLLSETEGTDIAKSTVEITEDQSAIRTKISAFVSSLNDTLSYLKSKTGTVVNQETETYTRGALAGDSVFSRLKRDLVRVLSTQVASDTEGDPEYLSDIGITVGNGLKISLNTSTLNAALESNFDQVVDLFDGVMQQFAVTLEPFTTETASLNTLDLYTESIETKIENIDDRVERMEKLIKAREESLIKQYSGLYMQSMQIQDSESVLLSIYSGFSMYA